ncbi:TetR family transcriptional regulator [Arthrobacter roseus]|uniref:TetR family transcriptional regulator n=1 Tax=Arthrobacter roseus TaxID=136274 RepID=UPI0019664E02|nr:AcrR family transcriptional regulator [Arthrobacter roseus]
MNSEELSVGEEALSRRLRQKAATRRGIGQAALTLARTRGLGKFTVDEVAEKADISRRTFFNYFASIEAAVNLPVEQFLDNALEKLTEEPAEKPILDAVLAAVAGNLDQDIMNVLIELCLMSDGSPELQRYELQTWSFAQLRLEEGLRQRLGLPTGAKKLFISCLAGVLMSCGREALNETTRIIQANPSLPESTTTFQELLLESITMLRSGFSLTD